MKSKLKFSILVLASIIIAGTIGFHLIEEKSLINSFYWTVITITTVGYGDITPETELGRIFSVFLITTGVGTILYILTAVGRNIMEGRLWEFFTMSEMEKEVESLEDHLIVCGYGDIGRTITQEILLGSDDVVIIDQDEEKLRESATDLPYYIIGDARKEEILEKARVNEARGLFATLPEDPDNILLCLSTKEINPDIRIIAKANSTEGEKHLRRAGAEAVVLPQREGGIRMARSLLHPEITSLYDHLLMGDVGRADAIDVPEGGKLDGETIGESNIRKEIGVSVIAVEREGEIITNPKVDEKIRGGDTLIVMGTTSQIKELKKSIEESSI